MATSVLITGANGQLGRELARADWPDGMVVHARSSAMLDITDEESVYREAEAVGAELIVNAAAYTAVDNAEGDEDRALAVNATGVRHLRKASDSIGAALVHVSTDYVFDGSKDGWYVEDDPVRPIGAYGRTKAEGEAEALAADRSLIVRTAWVYGALGSNFVATMLRLAAERNELGVVADQWGCPSATADLASAIIGLGVASCARDDLGGHRIFHAASPTDTNWFDFANAVFDNSSGRRPLVRALTTAEYPTAARRPANSRLSTERLRSVLGEGLRPWQQALPEVVAELEGREMTPGTEEIG